MKIQLTKKKKIKETKREKERKERQTENRAKFSVKKPFSFIIYLFGNIYLNPTNFWEQIEQTLLH